jgi:hypothetical protein
MWGSSHHAKPHGHARIRQAPVQLPDSFGDPFEIVAGGRKILEANNHGPDHLVVPGGLDCVQGTLLNNHHGFLLLTNCIDSDSARNPAAAIRRV